MSFHLDKNLYKHPVQYSDPEGTDVFLSKEDF